MTWAAVGIGAASLISGQMSANKANSAQQKAAHQAELEQKNQLAGQSAVNAPWLNRGNESADELQALMGLGNNDDYNSLYNKLAGEYTTYENAPRRKKKGGLFSKLKNIDAQADIGSSYLGIKSQKTGGPPGTIGRLNKAALDARIRSELDKQKKRREDPRFGFLTKRFTNEDFVRDPGYEFRLGEGEKGVNRALAARGGFDSGAALKELNRYNQGFASNEFGNAYNRFTGDQQSIYNRYAGIAGTGQQAAGHQVGILGDYGQGMQNIYGQRGNADANYAMAQGSNINNALSTGYGVYAQNKALKQPQNQQAPEAPYAIRRR